MPHKERQKSLGQFFSGPQVAELLLALLPPSPDGMSIVDPMCGIGDLLLAAKHETHNVKTIVGVEIDSKAAKVCQNKITSANIFNEDAFRCAGLHSACGFDLVITNPPYVRYQLSSNTNSIEGDVRSNLVSQIESFKYLDDTEKRLFLKLASNYSGQSDLAVPAWILCAALTRHDRFLAIVVPETWLSREYARPIQYMLLKFFDILTVVKDVNAAWFKDAQVRTCLVVARRKHISELLRSMSNEVFSIDLTSKASDGNSLVGLVSQNGIHGISALKNIVSNRLEIDNEMLRTQVRKVSSLFPCLLKDIERETWFDGDEISAASSIIHAPHEILSIVTPESKKQFCLLSDFGAKCWQGLRSGANDFFYFKICSKTNLEVVINGKPWLGSETYTLPKRYVLPLLHKWTDSIGLVASPEKMTEGVLVIKDAMRASDLEKADPSLLPKYQKLNSKITSYIDAAELVEVKRHQKFYELSAVAPNIKSDKNGMLTSCWYMLPPLTLRHLPLLCIPRINGGVTKCILVKQTKTRPLVVDANFITITCPQKNKYKLFALLNSTWFKAYMESFGTIFGGGALKCETVNLQNVLFPRMGEDALKKLDGIGRKIARTSYILPTVQAAIDAIVFAPVERRPKGLQRAFSELLNRKMDERNASHD